MLKGQLCELILRTAIKDGLLDTDDAKRVSIRQVALETDLIYADAIALILPKDDSISLDYFTKSYVYDVKYDSATKEYYFEFEPEIVQLPMNKGVKLVRGVGSNRKFYMMSNEALDFIDDMETKNYYDRVAMVLEGGKKVILKGFGYASSNIRQVQAKLVVRFSEYAMDEEVNIPSGKSTEFTGIVAQKIFSNKKFLYTSSDGNSN